MKTKIHRDDNVEDVIRAIQILMSETPYDIVVLNCEDDNYIELEIRESTWEICTQAHPALPSIEERVNNVK